MTGDRLDSWKEIAAYLRRSVRTVTRWEREEGLPVHRHLHAKAGTVYAFKAELDTWWQTRSDASDDTAPATATSLAVPTPRVSRWWWLLAGIGCALLAVVWLSGLPKRSSPPPAARALPLTTLPGIEGPPSLSPDGNQVAFERTGQIFVKQVEGEATMPMTNGESPAHTPAWSPDGRQIAFVRDNDGIFVTSSLGGNERKVAPTQTPLLLKAMSWTPDGRSLVLSELTSSVCASLFVLSIDTGDKRRLTSPPEPSIGDGWPAVSPDGRTVAFARYTQDTAAKLYVVPIGGGEPRAIDDGSASIFGLAWLSDRELIVSSNRNGTPRLWRLSLDSSPAAMAAFDVAGDDARFPSVARLRAGGSARLAFQRLVENVDIRRAEIVGEGTAAHALKPSEPFITSTKSDDHPRYSPDGRRIAFASQRSGTQEIWVSASDGSNPVRLTSLNGPVVTGPQWSLDGRKIAFFAAAGVSGNYAAYVVDSEGGRPIRLNPTATTLEALPSWSRDGRSIYLTSSRSATLQIWKMPIAGGEPVQLTKGGGAEAMESPDGRTVYYTKVPEVGPGLWSVPAEGGGETRVLDSVRFGFWTVSLHGLYFIDFDTPAGARRPVRFYHFASHQATQVGTVEATVSWRTAPGFAISPDGRWLLYSSLESTEADLMMVDGLGTRD